MVYIKTNCFWFDLGLTLVSGWVSDQTTAAAETVQMEEEERNDHWKTVCSGITDNPVLNSWNRFCTPPTWTRVCILWWTSRLKVRSKAAVLAGGEGCRYLWAADMGEKQNLLPEPNDVFFWREKSKHFYCLVMWPSEGSGSGHRRKGLCFN